MRVSLYRLPLFLWLLFLTVPGLAQDCDEDISEKAKKLVEKGKDRKKYGKEKRMEYLRAAVEEEEDYVEANFLLGVETMKTAKAKGYGYKAIIPYFEKVASLCPNYHTDVYYYLSVVYLGDKQYEKALTYQERFLNFSNEDPKAYGKKYEEHLEEINRDLDYTKFYVESYAHPVPFNPVVVRDVSTNEADEYLPLLSPDNENLFFTRRVEDKTEDKNSIVNTSDRVRYIEKFTKAEYSNGKYTVGEAMPPPFNEDEDINYGGVSVSLNNRHMFLTICKPTFLKESQQMIKNCDIYQSNYVLELNAKTGQGGMALDRA
jgi:tetratricopeptide (TPR) repeat protein